MRETGGSLSLVKLELCNIGRADVWRWRNIQRRHGRQGGLQEQKRLDVQLYEPYRERSLCMEVLDGFAAAYGLDT